MKLPESVGQNRQVKILVGRLIILRAITRTRFEVKRSKVKVSRPINAETESVLPTNFKLGRRLEHVLSTIKACEVGLLHTDWGILGHPAATPQLVVYKMPQHRFSIVTTSAVQQIKELEELYTHVMYTNLKTLSGDCETTNVNECLKCIMSRNGYSVNIKFANGTDYG